MNKDTITVTTVHGVKKSATSSQVGIRGGISVGIDLKALAEINGMDKAQLCQYLFRNNVIFSQSFTQEILRDLAVMHENGKLDEDAYLKVENAVDVDDSEFKQNEVDKKDELLELENMSYDNLKAYLTMNDIEFKGNASRESLLELAIANSDSEEK